MTELIEAIPLTPETSPDWGEAVRLLEQVTKAGNQEPATLYLLALAYKHLGRIADARRILAKVAEPDEANLLQRGILAFMDRDFAAAAGEFQKAWQQNPADYTAAYNLMLAHLSQGQTAACVEMLGRVAALAPNERERRFLELLRGLLGTSTSAVSAEQEALLASLSAEEEERLLAMILGLGTFNILYMLLTKLVTLRPGSPAAFRAYINAALVQAKGLADRCQWSDAALLLAPLKRRVEASPIKIEPLTQTSLYNLLGVCACMEQDFERGIGFYRLAQESFQRSFPTPTPNDRNSKAISPQGNYQGAWLEQNLALAFEWMGRYDQSEIHWNKYFDLLEQHFPRSMPPEHLPNLAFEGMSRLADLFSRKERWGSAVHFLQRAHRVRPADYETMERLFNLFTQMKRTEEARRVMRRLREMRPDDPQAELFELEVREVRKIDEIDRLVADLRKLMQRFAGDARVEEKAATIAANLVPSLERLADTYAGQVNKVVDQMRRLPNYQINWPTVRDLMRDLEDRYQMLRRVAQRCHVMVHAEDARRELNRLMTHCDRKIDQCHSLGD